MTLWPKDPQCGACKAKPCGTYHVSANGEWRSLCCSAPVVTEKKKPVEVSA